MQIPRRSNRKHSWWHLLRQAMTMSLLVALLAGLIPPPKLIGFGNLSALFAPHVAQAAPFAAPLAQATTDIDLITNISSDKTVALPTEPVNYTVTVENRGPATATNVEWQVIVRPADTITNTVCVANGNGTCPNTFIETTVNDNLALNSVIPSLDVNGVVTLTFTGTGYSQSFGFFSDETPSANYKVESIVTPNGQTDSHLETNDTDINIFIKPQRYSYGVQKSILRYEDGSGNVIGSPIANGVVVYEVTVTNDGIDDIYNLNFSDGMSARVGTGTAIVDTRGNNVSSGIVYADGATLLSINCVGTTSGAQCPADVTFTHEDTSETLTIPFMPGRTESAVADPVSNPVSTVTFQVTAQIGDVLCSTVAGTTREIVNSASLAGPGEASTMGAPYGPGDFADNNSSVTFAVDAPVCALYNIVTDITQPTAQATSGIDEVVPYEYTVTVANGGPSGVSDIDFVFGLYFSPYDDNGNRFYGSSLDTAIHENFWVIDNGIACTPSGGAICPTGYTVTPQSDEDGDGQIDAKFELPDVAAVIPSLPSGGSLVFTISGTSGALNQFCMPEYVNAYAYSLPPEATRDTNYQYFSSFLNLYLNSSQGWPAAAGTNGYFAGDNGYNLRTQWNTHNAVCNGITYDLAEQTTGPFSTPNGTVPIAGPLPPGEVVYYRAQVSNIAPGIDFSSSAVEDTDLYASVSFERRMCTATNCLPSWIDTTSTGLGETMVDFYHPDDPTPGIQSEGGNTGYSGWGAMEDIGFVCENATGGAQCPADTLEVWSVGNSPSETTYRGSFNVPSFEATNVGGLELPVGSSMEFIVPYQVPNLAIPCIAGGDTYVQNSNTFFDDGITANIPIGLWEIYLGNERSSTNNTTNLEFTMEIPDCLAGIDLDKRLIGEAASGVMPADNVIQYEVDLIFDASATQSLDVAQFTDIPTPNPANTGDVEIINVVSCQVISGNATCPPTIPIGQQRTQDGTLTTIDDGTIDVRWGTPGATSVVGGAAFEPGSTIRITLEAQLSNEELSLNDVVNTATFGSDGDTSIFGGQFYIEDTVSVTVPDPSNMILNKQVSPTAPEQGEEVTYTIEVINNGLENGMGAVMTDTLPTGLTATNPTGYQNITCAPITSSPPLYDPPAIADCANVTITDNGVDGFRVDFTGDWLANTGYRFTFTVIAPLTGTSIENTAELTPPPSTIATRFSGISDSTANFRTPDGAVITLDKVVVTPTNTTTNVGDPVLYDLVVTNTGPLTVTEITVVDSYDAAYLQYDTASIAPTAQATGVLTWTLAAPTAPLPLGVGEAMTVTVNFTAIRP